MANVDGVYLHWISLVVAAGSLVCAAFALHRARQTVAQEEAEEAVSACKKAIREVETEWENTYNQMRSLLGRLDKSTARAKNQNQDQGGGVSPGNAAFPSFTDRRTLRAHLLNRYKTARGA